MARVRGRRSHPTPAEAAIHEVMVAEPPLRPEEIQGEENYQ